MGLASGIEKAVVLSRELLVLVELYCRLESDGPAEGTGRTALPTMLGCGANELDGTFDEVTSVLAIAVDEAAAMEEGSVTVLLADVVD
jgi:hypothetical protein